MRVGTAVRFRSVADVLILARGDQSCASDRPSGEKTLHKSIIILKLNRVYLFIYLEKKGTAHCVCVSFSSNISAFFKTPHPQQPSSAQGTEAEPRHSNRTF